MAWLEQQNASKFVRVEVVPSEPLVAPELVVEVGRARIAIRAGFDAALLRDVVRALGSE